MLNCLTKLAANQHAIPCIGLLSVLAWQHPCIAQQNGFIYKSKEECLERNRSPDGSINAIINDICAMGDTQESRKREIVEQNKTYETWANQQSERRKVVDEKEQRNNKNLKLNAQRFYWRDKCQTESSATSYEITQLVSQLRRQSTSLASQSSVNERINYLQRNPYKSSECYEYKGNFSDIFY